MLELSGTTVLAAMVFAVATSITPGPNNTMLLASGVNFGFARTLPHLLGVCGGLLFILLLGAVGLQQWLFQLPWLRDVIHWLGAAYLTHLSWRLFQTQGVSSSASPGKAKPMTFVEAAVFQWLNPKVWAMVFGFFSTYVPADASWADATALCVVFAGLNGPCVGLWAYAGHKLNVWLRVGQRMTVFNRSMAVLLMGSVVAALVT